MGHVQAERGQGLNLVEEERPVKLIAHCVADVSNVQHHREGVIGCVGCSVTNGLHGVEAGRKSVGRRSCNAHISEQVHVDIGRGSACRGGVRSSMSCDMLPGDPNEYS